MNQLENRVELELADFVTKVISDVFAGVAVSVAEQARRRSEILQCASLDLREYAQRHICEEQLVQELAALFPCKDDEHPHAIFAGSPYQPKRDNAEESPPVFKLIGLRLDENDYFKNKESGFLLNAEGIKKILTGVRFRIATVQRETLRAMVKEGLPGIVVDSGKVLAKVTFALSDGKATVPLPFTGDSAAALKSGEVKTDTEPTELKPETLTATFDKTLPANLVKRLSPELKLVVKQANENASHLSSKTGHAYGEVEITFKTVN